MTDLSRRSGVKTLQEIGDWHNYDPRKLSDISPSHTEKSRQLPESLPPGDSSSLGKHWAPSTVAECVPLDSCRLCSDLSLLRPKEMVRKLSGLHPQHAAQPRAGSLISGNYCWENEKVKEQMNVG